MPILVGGRLLILNRVPFTFFILVFGPMFVLFLWALAQGYIWSSLVMLWLLWTFMSLSCCWLGRRAAWYVPMPWRRFKYKDVYYFDIDPGEKYFAEMADGRRRWFCVHGGSFFDRPETQMKRDIRVVEALEGARIRAGGLPNPPRRTRPGPRLSGSPYQMDGGLKGSTQHRDRSRGGRKKG